MKKKCTPHAPKQGLRVLRVFSEAFRRQRVLDIEQGLISVSETHRIYHVSFASIYRWIHKYSTRLEHHTRQVVELESEQHRTKMLLDRVADLERALGQKQLQIDITGKMLEEAEEQLGPDWKKKR